MFRSYYPGEGMIMSGYSGSFYCFLFLAKNAKHTLGRAQDSQEKPVGLVGMGGMG